MRSHVFCWHGTLFHLYLLCLSTVRLGFLLYGLLQNSIANVISFGFRSHNAFDSAFCDWPWRVSVLSTEWCLSAKQNSKSRRWVKACSKTAGCLNSGQVYLYLNMLKQFRADISRLVITITIFLVLFCCLRLTSAHILGDLDRHFNKLLLPRHEGCMPLIHCIAFSSSEWVCSVQQGLPFPHFVVAVAVWRVRPHYQWSQWKRFLLLLSNSKLLHWSKVHDVSVNVLQQ